MARQSNSKPATLRSIFGTAMLQRESLLFVLVSALDVFMTYILLSHSGGQFVESNPIARFFIQEWGPKGMVYFKFATVAFVCFLAQVIVRQRPQAARALLLGATALISVVVIYSFTLLLRHGDVFIDVGFNQRVVQWWA